MIRFLVILIVTAVGMSQATADETRPGLSPEERLYGLSLLWMETKYNFAYFDQVPDLDWDGAYREFLPRALESEETYAYYRLLQRFYGLLQDGHTGVYMPSGLVRRGSVPLEAELMISHYRGEAWQTENEPQDIEPAPPGEGISVPVVVLTGYHTTSAAEDFLVYMDQLEHVTFIGRRTKGSTGQPLKIDLPGGGWARVCTRRVTFPDGRDLVGVGVLPDIEIPRNLEEILGDDDVTLERAVRFLLEEGEI